MSSSARGRGQVPALQVRVLSWRLTTRRAHNGRRAQWSRPTCCVFRRGALRAPAAGAVPALHGACSFVAPDDLGRRQGQGAPGRGPGRLHLGPRAAALRRLASKRACGRSLGPSGQFTFSRPTQKASPWKGEAVERSETDEGAHAGDAPNLLPLIRPFGPPTPLWGEGFAGGHIGPPLCRRKLHIPRFRLAAKARSFRCSSSPHATRFAGLARGPHIFGRFLP